MNVLYKSLCDFPPGTMLRLLRDAYSFDERYERDWLDNWREADAFFCDHPDIACRCGFYTVKDGAVAGFICWDPRRLPEYAEIGHNCISASRKGEGLGRAQLGEAVRRIAGLGAKKIIVTTDEGLLPARRN